MLFGDESVLPIVPRTRRRVVKFICHLLSNVKLWKRITRMREFREKARDSGKLFRGVFLSLHGVVYFLTK